MSPLLFLLVLSTATLASAGLQVGFYDSTCPYAETIVQAVVQQRFINDSSVTAALLRMHFHDCFVHGCDASILIDSPDSEKQAVPNLSVRGFDIIDEAKANLEVQCPSTVSCADIIALATRDAVALASGLNYAVPTGRQDGLVSNGTDVLFNLPAPTFSLSQSLDNFTAKGLTLDDMVVLLGGHTVGVSHCGSFRHRLFDFEGTAAPDTTMDAALVASLNSTCGAETLPLESDPTVVLEETTPSVVDNRYYNQILANMGILQIDQEIALDSSTVALVTSLASDGAGFLQSFADAMVKLGSIEVLVDGAGEIRTTCNAFNTPS